MIIPEIRISSDAMRKMLTETINSFIRIEKSEVGLSYQQSSSYVRGQISMITALLHDTWDRNRHSYYYLYLKYIVDKYALEGVWRINDLFDAKERDGYSSIKT